MNILADSLPRLVDIAGRKYPINYDFRTGIKSELINDNPELTDEQKAEQTLKLYYPIANWTNSDINSNTEEYATFVSNIPAAFKAISNFVCGWIPPRLPNLKQRKASRAFSFYYDSDLIYASFWQQYKIDLRKAKLHWYEFMSLLYALNDDTPAGNIRSIRQRDTSRVNKEQKSELDSLKHEYAIDEKRMSEEEKEQQRKTLDIFIHGGDLADLKK